ncbi:ECF transporter S component [Brevibacillus brevis]|uniref:ECF transporter S component n=1 Tax=Brevibacillus brevis TaxID=1393 RepID=A0ABY9T862_BREBE|nr:ECF transporter S component [Brevibacillus brevis]WNC16283.1 ECF transporter S component [Brevibacillus brevis]
MDSTFTPRSTSKTKTIVINALFIAFTLAATMFINIRLPIMGNGGLIHLGNVPLFIAAFVFGKRTGAVAGAFGMGLFDLISGWTAWAPFTFIIVGAMGYVAGLISEKVPGNRVLVYSLAVVAALVIKIVGYYFVEVILYSNWIQPFGSIPGNFLQVVVAGIIVVPLAERLRKIARQM